MQTIKDLGKYTFGALLTNSVKKFASRPALSYVDEKPLTYKDFSEKVVSLQKLLFSLGINGKEHDKVALYARSMPNWGVSYFALATMSAVSVPLLPDFSESEVANCLAHSEAKAVIVSKKLADKIPDFAEIVICMEDFSIIKGEKIREEEEILNIECEEEDTASIIYTSGTMGRPKGVELSHKNLVFTAIAGQECQKIKRSDCALSILPMSHVYEFTIGFLMFFLNGACVYYLKGMPTASVLLPALKKVKPTIMLSVPMVIEKIYKNSILPEFTKTHLRAKIYKNPIGRKILSLIAGRKLKKTFGGKIKFFGLGGSKTDPVVEQFMKDAHFPYAIGYGLTETSPLIAFSPVKKTLPDSVGFALSELEIKIDRPDKESGIGELFVKGANVMKGYYKDEELTRASFTADGFFKTGDLFALDSKSARLSIKGRCKNMILGANGENIYPEDVEFILNHHPLVSESLVVEGEGSSLVAYVKLNEEKIDEKGGEVPAERGDKGEIKKSEGVAGRKADGAIMGFFGGKGKGETQKKERDTGVQSMIYGTVKGLSEAFSLKKEEIIKEIKEAVNVKVNKSSKIDKIEIVDAFEKTASQKIKRYIYTLLAMGKGGQHKEK